MDASTFRSPPVTAQPTAGTPAVDHPGRWIGGLVGAVASLVFALGSLLVDGATTIDVGVLTMVGLLGVPVGFVLGRAALPWARDDGWRHAAVVGLALGWAAPPLGALEIVVAMGLLEDNGGVAAAISCSTPGLVGALILLLYAVPVSFIAIAVTIPVGIMWGLATRALPDRWLQRARMPSTIAALGVRHVVLILAVIVLAVAVVQIATAPACAG